MWVRHDENMRLSQVVTTGISTAAPFIGIPVFRDNFRSTAFFAAEVATDNSGVARVSAALPHNVTRYRVLAIAADATDRVGSGEASIRTALSLVYRPILPRFVRGGDSLFASGVVSMADGVDRRVTVSASAQGTHETTTRDTTVQTRSSSAALHFSWNVSENPPLDSVAFSVTAVADDVSDAVRLAVPVRPVGRPRVHAASGTVRGTGTLSVMLPADTDIARSRVRLRLGSPALTFLREAAEQALAPRYEFTEQLASNLRVLVATLRAQRAGVDIGLDSSRVRAAAAGLVRTIESRTRPDGAVRYWPVETWTNAWVSGEAGLALLDARDAGFDTRADVRDRLRVYLRGAAPDVSWRGRGTAREQAALEASALSQQLHRAWYLRRMGDSLPAVETELRARALELAWEDRAWLAELLAEVEQPAEAIDLLDALWREVPPAGALVDLPSAPSANPFSSRLRGGARLLSATRRLQPEHALLGALERRMLDRGIGAIGDRAHWWNTQDFAWAVPALLPAAITSGTERVRLDAAGLNGTSATLIGTPSGVADTLLPAAGFTARRGDSLLVSVRLASDRPAFVVLEVEEVSLHRPMTPDARGLWVERWYERTSDGQRITELTEGEFVRVHLRVQTSAERDFVALEDLLPAGLEVVDPSLNNASTGGLTFRPGSYAARLAAAREAEDEDPAANSDAWRWWSGWQHRQVRDDRVQFFARYLRPGSHSVSYLARATTSGRFVRPPAQAAEMYNPGVQGRSDGGWLGVLRCGDGCP